MSKRVANTSERTARNGRVRLGWRKRVRAQQKLLAEGRALQPAPITVKHIKQPLMQRVKTGFRRMFSAPNRRVT